MIENHLHCWNKSWCVLSSICSLHEITIVKLEGLENLRSEEPWGEDVILQIDLRKLDLNRIIESTSISQDLKDFKLRLIVDRLVVISRSETLLVSHQEDTLISKPFLNCGITCAFYYFSCAWVNLRWATFWVISAATFPTDTDWCVEIVVNVASKTKVSAALVYARESVVSLIQLYSANRRLTVKRRTLFR